MCKTGFMAVMVMALVMISVSCKKSEKPESLEIPSEAVQIKVIGEETAPATPLLFKLDGKADDWARIEPFWEEVGPAGSGLGEHSIDIKQVYFKNDAQYLYAFMKIKPTIEERFKVHPFGDIIGNLFLDTDNNSQTGSNAAEGTESDAYKGYEIRVWIPVGVVSSSSGESFPSVSYEIYTHEGGFRGINRADRQNTMDEGSLIAFGPDGVEFALKLEALKIAVPASFRVMLDQHASAAGDQSYSLGQLTLEASK
jgi:hypothetical protein